MLTLVDHVYREEERVQVAHDHERGDFAQLQQGHEPKQSGQVFVQSLLAQGQRLYFLPLPHGHGSFRPVRSFIGTSLSDNHGRPLQQDHNATGPGETMLTIAVALTRALRDELWRSDCGSKPSVDSHRSGRRIVLGVVDIPEGDGKPEPGVRSGCLRVDSGLTKAATVRLRPSVRSEDDTAR